MNVRQRSFAEHFATHHNGARAAIEAGYSQRRAKQTAKELLDRPDVQAMVAELDAETAASLGIDARWIADTLRAYAEGGLAGTIPATAGVRSLEVLAQMTGMTRPEPVVAVEMPVFRLSFDRNLDDDDLGA